MSKTSVIIINYENAAFLDRCITSVLKNDTFEIIFVDNNSKDNSIKIAEKYPVKIIKNKDNLGPVKARNVGAKEAGGELLFFLDSDVELDENYINELEKFLLENKNTGVVVGKILDKDSGERIWYNFGKDPNKFIDLIGHPLSIIAQKISIIKPICKPFTLNFIKDKKTEVDWVIEMAFMIKKDIFEKVGGMDERYFMFFEGPDLCREVREKGFKVFYIPEVSGIHLHGDSISTKRWNVFQESRKKYFEKWSK